jgi:serine/threonine-protein kinase
VPTDPLIGTEVSGYRIEELVGRGGMGVVYRAEHILLGRTDAIKLLAPDLAEDQNFRERFLRESRLAASIDHPNIVPIYHAGETNGLLFIAMRYVGGTDLKTVLKEQGKLSAERTVAIVDQVGSALDAAHARGLVHRDVKPANILLATADRVYLTDFGIAKHTATRGGLTQTGSFLGTLDYAAPEQIEGKDLDGRADIYALGCVVYQCLTGAVPFEKDTEVQIIYAHLLEPPPLLSSRGAELPAAMDAVIATALAKSRDERYPSCEAFTAGLRAALDGEVPRGAEVRGTLARETRTAPPAQTSPPAAAPPPRPAVEPAPRPAERPAEPAPVTPRPAPAQRRRLRLPHAALALGAAAIVVGVVVAVAALREGSTFPNAEEERLLSLVPGPIRPSCKRATETGLACSSGRQLVSYRSFGDGSALDRAFRARLSGLGVRRDSGACAEQPFLGEGPFRSGGRAVGRLACSKRGAEALAVWSDERLGVLSEAVRGDGDIRALYRWWRTSAGPTRQGTGGRPRTAAVARGRILFRDGFSDPAVGWVRTDQEAVRLGYSRGLYLVVVKRPRTAILSATNALRRPLAFGDAAVQVAATRVAGRGGYTFGVACRESTAPGPETFYALLVSAEGKAQIVRRLGPAEERTLAGPRRLPRGLLRGRNVVQGACTGGRGGPVRLALSVNGRQVLTARDRRPLATSGAVGIVVSSASAGGVAVAFDDLVVRKR